MSLKCSGRSKLTELVTNHIFCNIYRNMLTTGEHILVCLSASPSNAKVIRAAARMANAFRARFTAVHVEAPGGEGMRDEDALRLRMNQRLAEQLGAKTVTLYGGDITRQIAEYARISGVSKIVLGRSYTCLLYTSRCV